MWISHATAAGSGSPGRVNEDYVAAGPDWAIVLDGATAPEEVDSGCVHSVAWLVHRLAAALVARLAVAGPGSGKLADLLADSIGEVCAAHAGTCDLANPDSPSSTVAITRCSGGVVECLVLADSPIAVRGFDGSIEVVADDRLAHLPGGPPYSFELVRRSRNSPGGFWVASTNPGAAHEAVTAVFPGDEVSAVAMVTDGVTRLIEWYGYSWRRLFGALADHGPDHVIGLVRDAERRRPRSRRKPHDDATALFMSFVSGQGEISSSG